MSDFQREERYAVFKLRDLVETEKDALLRLANGINAQSIECVVVESDWPNYEHTWQTIERVSDGSYSDPYAEIEQLRAKTAYARFQGMLNEDDPAKRAVSVPVAWWDGDTSAAEDSFSFKLNRCYTIPLYTHPASSEVERLQARVAELYDLIKYAQVDSGVCMCGDYIKDHNQASGHSPVDVWDHAVEQINKEGSSEAFILRKQAEAVQASREALEGEAIGEVGYMFQPNWDDPNKTKRVALVDKSLAPGTKLYTHPASRQEGEPIGFLQSSGVSQLSGGHPAKLYPIGATPSPFESSTLVYTHPARDGQDSVAVVNKASTGEYEFYPSSNLVDIPNGMHKLYTHPASADVQAVSVPKQWVDLMRELVKDLISEIKTKQSRSSSLTSVSLKTWERCVKLSQ